MRLSYFSASRPSIGVLWGLLGALGAVLGSLGAVLGHLGAVLGLSGGLLELSWPLLGLSSAVLGLLGAVLGSLGLALGAKNVRKTRKFSLFPRVLSRWCCWPFCLSSFALCITPQATVTSFIGVEMIFVISLLRDD